jgi:hypothetical protein
VEVLRDPERETFRQVEAPNRRKLGNAWSIARFGNEEMVEMGCSEFGLTLTTGCQAWRQAARLGQGRGNLR